jgi:hypothetical protein
MLCLVGLTASAYAQYDWRWAADPEFIHGAEGDLYLTDRNGSRAAAQAKIGNDQCARVAYLDDDDNSIWVVMIDNGQVVGAWQPDPDEGGANPCIAISPRASQTEARMHVLWRSADDQAWYCDAQLGYTYDDWPVQQSLCDGLTASALALATSRNATGDTCFAYACFRANPSGSDTDGVWFRRGMTDSATSWQPRVEVSAAAADQITMAAESDWGHVYIAYHYVDAGSHKVALWRSSDRGAVWTEVAGSPWSDAAQPCLALVGSRVVLGMVKAATGGNPTLGGKVHVVWTNNRFGSTHGPQIVSSYSDAPGTAYNSPSIELIKDRGTSSDLWNLVVVSEAEYDYGSETWLSVTSGRGYWDSQGPRWSAYREHHMPSEEGVVWEDANPCVVTYDPGTAPVKASCFWSDDMDGFQLYRSDADFVEVPKHVQLRPVVVDGTGGRLRVGLNGSVEYVARVGANVHFGKVIDGSYLQPILVAGGGLPALAVDGAGKRWVAYWRDDTIWCRLGTGQNKPVFCGSGTALPGQPSIV